MLALGVISKTMNTDGKPFRQVFNGVISSLPFLAAIFALYIAFRVSLMSVNFEISESSLKTSELVRMTENPLHFMKGIAFASSVFS